MAEPISDENQFQEKSPIGLIFEISKSSEEMREALENLWWEHGLGKPIFFRDITHQPTSNQSSPIQLGALALPLSKDKYPEWLIITTDGNFVKISPPKNEDWGEIFKKDFSNKPYIEIPENQFNLRFIIDSLYYCTIPYDTNVDPPNPELKKQIEEDLEKALSLEVTIPNKRLVFQLNNLQMALAKIRKFLGKSPGKSPQEEKI